VSSAERGGSCPPDLPSCKWKYSFCYLPSGWFGGEQEFILHFDAEGVVGEVELVRTQ
jgi:hypothetical protein